MRSRLLAITALVAALVLGACGGGSPKSSAKRVTGKATSTSAGNRAVGIRFAKLIADAPDKAAEAKSARVAMSLDEHANGMSLSITMEGAIAFDGSRGNLTMDMGSIGEVELRIVEGVYYMKLNMLGGDKWIKADSPELTGSSATDPTNTLEALRGVSSDVQQIGREQVRGTDATRYRATLDMGKAIESVPESQREKVGKSLQLLGRHPVPAEIWIGDDGIMRKMTMRYEIDLSKASSASGSSGIGSPTTGTATVDMTMEMYDFGTVIDVQAPPPDQITDASSMLGALGGSSSS